MAHNASAKGGVLMTIKVSNHQYELGVKCQGQINSTSVIRLGYNLDVMGKSACLGLNPITVYSYGFVFNCTTVGQA